ncbi:MAG: exo-alpha-sialidase [Pirellulales bacterium]|nr:exo-alpha-sialidase [Pirellulales bacterium]
MEQQLDASYHRTPLTAAISVDDGQSWSHIKNLETDPKGLFCYTAIEFVDDHVLLAYCAGRSGVREGLSTTKISRLPWRWFRTKSDSAP